MENLVKKWEMQASHFKDFSQWSEIDHDNYTVSVNGGDVVDGSVAYEIGNYNALMADCPAYKKCKIKVSTKIREHTISCCLFLIEIGMFVWKPSLKGWLAKSCWHFCLGEGASSRCLPKNCEN